MKMTPDEAAVQLSHLRQLEQHPGWRLVCARFELGLQQLKESAFDMKRSDEIALRIRHAGAVVPEFAPEVLAKEMATRLQNIINSATPKADAS